MSSDGDVARSPRREENSEIKSDLEEEGGRQIVRMIKDKEGLDVVVKRTHKDSKEVKVGSKILTIFIEDR